MKLPRRTISASGRGRCRAAGRVAHRAGANLSGAAGANHRRLCGRRPTDIVARLIGQWLSERLGQPIHRREPAGCRQQYRYRGGRAVAARRLYAPRGRRVERDQRDALRQSQFQFHPRHRAGREHRRQRPTCHGGHPSVPAKTVPEFIAYAKANPGKVNMASPGIGGPLHLAGELFKMMAGVDLAQSPIEALKPALTDLISGQVQVMFVALDSW